VADQAFNTPEVAALAQWADYPEANARVIEVNYQDGDYAVVTTDTEPSHPMVNYCIRTREGWVFTDDHS